MEKQCVILKWNPAISSFNMIRFLSDIVDGCYQSDWSIWEYEKVKKGDQFFMLKVGVGTCGIVAAGTITSAPSPGPDWSGKGRKVFYSDYACELMINPETLPVIESSVLQDNIPDFDWNGGHSGVVLSSSQADVLNRLYMKYLQENAAVFADRLDLIKQRKLLNDQIYINRNLFQKIREA